MRGALFDPLFGASGVASRLDDAAWVAALLAVEVALAQSAAAHGVIPATHAAAIAAASPDLDPAALGLASVEGGNPVIPLVRALRAAVGPQVAPSVHPGATSQDVMDTAAALLTGWAGEVVLDDLRGAADAAAALAAAHRDTPMIARTLGQHALPTTFGLVAAGWCAGLDRARTRLAALLAAQPVQVGGPAGTLDGLPAAVVTDLAGRLGLADPGVPWHAERSRIGELAAALGVAAGTCAKPATDVVALAGVGEVSEAAPGDSSSMPHKRNPIAAVTARGAARRAPGLVAVLLAAMDGEHQRAAGAWHAEWETRADLLRATGGAGARLRVCLTGLQVHPDRMAEPLGASAGVGRAPELVDRTLAARPPR
ncbi:lyase family protein [Pseudonocardia sp.]|uniref:lyase family protein n=1 Tax=Pseudonocardia sp. TaxID=60912 RepID=UPI0026059B6B|nr:lyase family protein [Pseudonocardia sp.]